MTRISFNEELDALRDSGLTEEQVKAIWALIVHVSAVMAGVELKGADDE